MAVGGKAKSLGVALADGLKVQAVSTEEIKGNLITLAAANEETTFDVAQSEVYRLCSSQFTLICTGDTTSMQDHGVLVPPGYVEMIACGAAAGFTVRVQALADNCIVSYMQV